MYAIVLMYARTRINNLKTLFNKGPKTKFNLLENIFIQTHISALPLK